MARPDRAARQPVRWPGLLYYRLMRNSPSAYRTAPLLVIPSAARSLPSGAIEAARGDSSLRSE